MPTIKKYEDLECWKESRILVKTVFDLTNKKTFAHSFRLIDQITSAAISVMSNIAEGFDSQTNPELIRFLKFARRSSSEVQSLSYVIKDTGHIEQSDFALLYSQCEKCRKLIDGFLRYLRRTKKPS